MTVAKRALLIIASSYQQTQKSHSSISAVHCLPSCIALENESICYAQALIFKGNAPEAPCNKTRGDLTQKVLSGRELLPEGFPPAYLVF